MRERGLTSFALAWLTLCVSIAANAQAEDQAEVLDAHALERPLTADDPLENLKHLWQVGARGLFFRMSGLAPANCGYFLAVDNWARVRPLAVESAIWFRDRELLTSIQSFSRAGTRIVIQNRVPLGGFQVSPQSPFGTALARVAPELASNAMIVLNGFSKLYTLHHEMVHYFDQESGLWDQLMDAINSISDGSELTRDQLMDVAFYIMEARAYHTELASLSRGSRLKEFAATDEHDEFTRVTSVNGRDFRQAAFARVIHNFNRAYARRFRALPEGSRRRAGQLLPLFIPNYPRDFTPEGDMSEALCRRNIPGDLARGIGVFGNY